MEGRRLLGQAASFQRKALDAEPKNPDYRKFLRNHFSILAETCISMDDHTAALASSLELPKLYPDGWEECHRAAKP